MEKIRYDSSILEAQIRQMYEITGRLNEIAEQVEGANRRLRWEVSISGRIRRELGRYAHSIRRLGARADRMTRVLDEVNELYQRTEKQLTRNGSGKEGEHSDRDGQGIGNTDDRTPFQRLLDWIRKVLGLDHEDDGRYEVDSIVFDEDGGYGGDQGAPQGVHRLSEQRDLYDIVRRYYPNMTDAEIAEYLRKLNSEGCSYVATVNTIFANYQGREEEFQRVFGFPMYGENGDLNFNRLIVDFYTATDNHNMGPDGDVIDMGEDSSSTEGYGATRDQQIYRAQSYLSQHGVNVDITTPNVTPENFRDMSRNGNVVIDYHYGNIYREDGSAVYINGGHAMVVTGVTPDGRFIVSSWGERYYLDPSEIVQRDGNQTHHNFVYFQYH